MGYQPTSNYQENKKKKNRRKKIQKNNFEKKFPTKSKANSEKKIKKNSKCHISNFYKVPLSKFSISRGRVSGSHATSRHPYQPTSNYQENKKKKNRRKKIQKKNFQKNLSRTP